MNEAHASMLLDIAKEQPDLHLDQISEELENQCGVQYDPNLCYRELKRRGRVLKVMARVAAQRDEYSRFLYWEEITALGVRPDQMCILDETGEYFWCKHIGYATTHIASFQFPRSSAENLSDTPTARRAVAAR